MLEFQQFYRRNLPHIQPPGATMFVTSLLDGAISMHVQQKLSAEARFLVGLLNKIDDPQQKAEQTYVEMKRLFGRWDNELDNIHENSPRWLEHEQIAELVVKTIQYLDGRFCKLLAYTIMRNHVHLVFTPLEKAPEQYVSISRIMHSWKRVSANGANSILGRSGAFWQHENYDHYARNSAELERIINYVKNNPVKAGLVTNWTDWHWSYVATYDL